MSTDSEEQMTSYETQLEFYTKMINENPKLYAMFAQAESESISNNEKDGRRKGYQIGKVPMMYGNVLGYRKGADGQAEIDKEEASIIIYIFSSYLNGCTIGAIKKNLEAREIKTIRGNAEWSPSVILSILKTRNTRAM